MDFQTIKLTHVIIVNIFILIYLIKTTLLVANKTTSLLKVSKIFKVPEMIVSTLFLITGVWMIVLMGTLQTILIIKIILVLASIPIAVVAFKKQKKALGILSFLLIIAAYGMAEMSKKPKVCATPAGVEVNGKELYHNNCQNCHGPKGDLGNNDAKDLSQSIMDHNTALLLLNNGKNKMISYNSLTDAEKNAVLSYIETLRNNK